MKNLIKAFAISAVVLSLMLVMVSCDMLPAELQNLLGVKGECAHTNTNTVATNEPTCKAKGLGDVVCSDCGETIESGVVLDKLDTHTPGEWEITKEPTCVADGERVQKCTVCAKQINKEVLEKIKDAHNYDFGVCTFCKGAQPTSSGLKFEDLGSAEAMLAGIGTCKDTSIIIPSVTPEGKTVTAIAESAFAGNTAIKSIKIPDTVTNIGANAFKDCTYEKVSAPAAVLPGVKLSSIKVLVVTGKGKIPAGAMNGLLVLNTIEICEGVTEIGDNAFQGCKQLISIVMPKSLKKIGQSAFYSCTALNTLKIGEGVTELAQSAFQDCDHLYTVYIPASVKSIGYRAFYQSPRIADVYFEVTEGWTRSGVPQAAADLANSQKAAKSLMGEPAWVRN